MIEICYNFCVSASNVGVLNPNTLNATRWYASFVTVHTVAPESYMTVT